ncbi:hypothetical protein EDB19DRAFT_1593727, partial [Suillus lakei]
PKFTLDEMHHHIVKFIVADDQDLDIPHPSKLHELICQAWQEYFVALKKELALRPFLAITAHWISKEDRSLMLVLKSALIAFHHVPGSHDGASLSSVILHLLDHADVMNKRGRDLVQMIRSSGQRREDFQKTITIGNQHKLFHDGHGMVIKLPNVELLYDTNMYALGFIVHYAPHAVQQSMSGETTPTLSGAVPALETLIERWEDIAKHVAHCAPIVNIGLACAQKYRQKMSETNAYAVAMFVNPKIRLTWIDRHWDNVRVRTARDYIMNLMREKSRLTTADSTQSPPAELPRPWSHAAGILGTKLYGLPEINMLHHRRGAQTADEEFNAYVTSNLSHEGVNVLASKSMFPTIYSIAMDYIPV